MKREEVYLSGKKYISLKQASRISGYAKDYIGQLCRSGKLEAERVGHEWFVGTDALLSYKNKNKKSKTFLSSDKLSSDKSDKIEILLKKIQSRPLPSSNPDEWDKVLLSINIDDKKEGIGFFARFERFLVPIVASLALFLLFTGYFFYYNQIYSILVQIKSDFYKIADKAGEEFWEINSSLASDIEKHTNQSGSSIMEATQIIFEEISGIEANIPDFNFRKIKISEITQNIQKYISNITETTASAAEIIIDKITIDFFE